MVTQIPRPKVRSKEKDRIHALDLLRASAILYIIGIWHVSDYTDGLFSSHFTRIVTLCALSILVFISSFMFSRKYEYESTLGLKEIKRFYVQRILRIFPLYLSALAMFFVTKQISFGSFIAGVFAFNCILNIQLKTLWFVSMIFVYYSLLPVFLYKYSVKRTLFISFVFLAGCAVLHEGLNLADIRLAYYFPPFLLGIICAKHSMVYAYLRNKMLVIVCLFLLSIGACLHKFSQSQAFDHILFFLCSPISVSPLITISESISSRIRSRAVLELSYASFCMYIYHRMVYWFLLHIYTPGEPILIFAYLACIGLPLLYIISKRMQSLYDSVLKKTNSYTSWTPARTSHQAGFQQLENQVMIIPEKGSWISGKE